MLPTAFIHSLNGVPGFDAEAFLAAHQQTQGITSIRFNPYKKQYLKEIPFATLLKAPIPWANDAWYLTNRPSFTLDPLLHAGAYYVQEASSMFIETILSQIIPKPTTETVLDISAAPGGKTTLLSGYFKHGIVVANEIIKSRAAILSENIVKWGADNIIVTNNEPRHFERLSQFFDVILLDAPCSGSGLFRKDKNAVEEWSVENVAACSIRQQKISKEIVGCLKPGGLFIYSTCSYSVEEDENITDYLCNEYGLESVRVQIQPEWGIVEVQSSLKSAWGYRFFPDKVKGEGFFVAAFKKPNTTDSVFQNLPEANIAIPSAKQTAPIEAMFQIPDTYQFFLQEDSFKIISKVYWLTLLRVSKHLYIKRAGISLGSLKGKDFIPSHELALSLLQLPSVNQIELNLNEALAYLRKQPIELNGKLGWNVVNYCGLRLGWVKVLPNRVNNYYPSEWRILKD